MFEEYVERRGRKKKIYTNPTVEEFFSKPLSIFAWRKGKQMFYEASNQSIPVEDGQYVCTLDDVVFSIPSRGRGLLQFVFVLQDGKKVVKAMSIDTSESVTLLMWEMSKFGIKISDPQDMDTAISKLRELKHTTQIIVGTSGIMRYVSINAVQLKSGNRKEDPSEPVVLKEAKPEDLKPREEIKQSVLEKTEEQEISEEPSEIDIRPGHRIVVKDEDKRIEATVIKTFEDDNELAVLLKDGKKVIISASDIVGFLG